MIVVAQSLNKHHHSKEWHNNVDKCWLAELNDIERADELYAVYY